MRNLRFTENQLVWILNEAEAGIQVKEVCRKNGISSSTFINGSEKGSSASVPSTRTLKDLMPFLKSTTSRHT